MARAVLVLAAVVLLVVAAALVAVPIWVSRQVSAEGLAQRASALAGQPVGVERVALAFRPGLRIRAEGVTVGEHGAAQAVEVELALGPLLERRLEPEELHLVGARIPVARTSEGGFRVALLDRSARPGGGLPPLLPALEAEDGELFLVEADGKRSAAPVLRIERLELAPLGREGRAPLRLEVAVAAAPGGRWSLGAARLEGMLAMHEGQLRIESARLEGQDARVRGLRFERFQASFGYADGAVAIEALELSGYGGTASASGRLRLGAARFEGSLEVAGAALPDLVRGWRGLPPAAEASSRWSLGSARFQGVVTLRDGASRIESGRLEGRDALLRGLRIEQFRARFGYADGAVAIETLEFPAYGGTGSASGRVPLGPARFEGVLGLEGVTLAQVVADWRGQPLGSDPGRLDGEATLSLPALSLADGSGQGRLTLRDGRLPARSLFDALLGSIGRLAGRLLSVGNATAPAPSKLERLSASFALRGGRMHSEDLDLVTDDYRYRARGSLGLDRSLDFAGTVQLTSRGLQRMLASAALPLPAATAAIPEIPLRVSGSLGEPSLTANAIGLPEAARGTLSGIVQGGGSVVKGAARGLRKVTDKVIGR